MKTLRKSLFIILLLTISLGVAYTYAMSTEITVTAKKDNTLYESTTGSVSNGIGQHLFAGKTNTGERRRGLIAFDFSEIPSGSIIESVTLTLVMSKTSSTAGQTVTLHRVTADWGEGSSDAGSNEGKGIASATNDATWIHRFFNNTLWNQAGGDFVSDISASQSVGNLGKYNWGSTEKMVADVQSWIDNPALNFGWILIGNEATAHTAKRFESRENGTEASRPTLTVSFLTTNVDKSPFIIPTEFQLAQNYPNPFNPSTVIEYTLPQSVSFDGVHLEVFNMIGEKVRTLVDAPQSPGTNSVEWDGRDDNGNELSSGVYMYRLRMGNFIDQKKMILMK